MINKNSPAFFRLMLCILSASALFGCSKDRNNEANRDASLVVRVSGLEDYVVANTKINLQAKHESRPPVTTNSPMNNLLGVKHSLSDDGKEHEIQLLKDFDVDFEIVKTHPASAGTDHTQKGDDAPRLSAQRSLIARQPLDGGVRYRLLIYRENETEPIVNTEATGSTFPDVGIASGFNYTWVAVSTNETTSSPNVSNNVVAAADIANKDFLYASGTLFTQTGQNYLNIVFKRYTSQIQLTVDSRGMFGNIAANSTISFVINGGETLSETADFNVRDSSFSNFQPVALSSNNMTNTDPALRVGTIYTVRPRAVAAGSLQLRLNPLLLTLDDGSTRTFADNSISFGSGFSPVRGSSYAISARLIESGIRVGSSPVRWARSNLTYAATAAEGFRYRFRPHPVNYIFDPNVDLWNFGTSMPNIPFDGVDPCQQVYPAGTWRLPSYIEVASDLGPPSSIQGYNLPGTGGLGIVANWDRSTSQPANSAYPDMDQVRLAFYGFRTTNGILQQQPTMSGTQLNGQGHYSSYNYDDQTNANTNTTVRRPVYLRMNYAGPNLSGSTNNLSNFSRALGGLNPDTSSVLNEGRSIRCVRFN
ncbi:fimbrillin family protein [Sphingobacterium paludis]|uniref:Major fimbrial subunit protein N-terminal domain-containing protein n=1 Tax=Sphingobacterium paludis TaxID=1476465 RepID=A0A4R7D0E0_9SPHI|nr:fimbrillin family protein [Sphingobacterium paludis]TDS13767.1 hypothetical protein B0I21_10493 [Sphingobacterium paludis]